MLERIQIIQQRLMRLATIIQPDIISDQKRCSN